MFNSEGAVRLLGSEMLEPSFYLPLLIREGKGFMRTATCPPLWSSITRSRAVASCFLEADMAAECGDGFDPEPWVVVAVGNAIATQKCSHSSTFSG